MPQPTAVAANSTVLFLDVQSEIVKHSPVSRQPRRMI